MSGGRKTVPLFDLLPKKPGIEDRGRVASNAAITPPLQAQQPTTPTPSPTLSNPTQSVAAPNSRTPVVAVEHKPIAKPVATESRSGNQAPSPTPAPVASPTPEHASRDTIEVPRFAFAVFVACLAALLVLAWITGYRRGQYASDRTTAEKIERNEGTLLNDPVANPPVNPQPDRTTQGASPPLPDTNVSAGDGTIYTAEGWVSTDPRQKPMNYLRLATLRREQAVQTVDYLKSKGKKSFAVPTGTVDRSPEGGKNPTYFVYLSTPLSRDQYRDSTNRARIENEIKEIGKAWAKAKERGPTDFAQPVWVKYE